MKVLFLCGGIGRRMFPLTEDKFLLQFAGKTLLEHQIQMALKAGLTDFILVSSPKNRKRIETIAKKFPTAAIEITVQEKPLGIANALQSAIRN